MEFIDANGVSIEVTEAGTSQLKSLPPKERVISSHQLKRE